jgi:hypothetical protein
MRLPRVRFTIRRMMIAVAVVAIVLVLGIPISGRLLWLYRAPFSINLVGGNIEPRWISLGKPAPVGQPVQVQCSYTTGVGASVPSGLIYKLSAQVQLIDRAGVVLETFRRTHYMVAHGEARKEMPEELACILTPLRPGSYTVRYETHVTDLFGRTGKVAIHTGGFTAQ